jgi:hypothetical protein
MWAFTGLLVIAGLVLFAWPTPVRHQYSQTVEIGASSSEPRILTFDAAAAMQAPAIRAVVDATDKSRFVAVELHSFSRTQVQDAANVVAATAEVVAPARARARAAPAVTVLPLASRKVATEQLFWPLATAAILHVIAIVALDALFLTRTRVVLPYEDEPTTDDRAPEPPRREEPRHPPHERTRTRARASARTRARTRTRTRAPRVAAQPLDLPNIEVHFIGREGGTRGVELRDAPGPPDAPGQH